METVEYTLLSHVHGKMDIRSLSHGMGKHQICNCAYTRARYSCKKASVVNAITEPHIGSNIINRKIQSLYTPEYFVVQLPYTKEN